MPPSTFLTNIRNVLVPGEDTLINWWSCGNWSYFVHLNRRVFATGPVKLDCTVHGSQVNPSVLVSGFIAFFFRAQTR